MNMFLGTINGMQEILAICPCCDDLFRLVDGRFVFEGTISRKANPYLDMVALEKKAEAAEERIELAEERFEERFEPKREKLIAAAQKVAKKRLRKIEPVFASRNIDHQDVKVIFDPVEYVVFLDMSEKERISEVRLVSREPQSTAAEKVLNSIHATIKGGNVLFETLQLNEDGSFVIKKTG